MRKLVLSVLGASALAIASAASAQTIITPGAPAPPNDPMTSFIVSGNIFLWTHCGDDWPHWNCG